LRAEIFSIGTELLMGELSDTNGSWIAAKLPPLGIQLEWMTIVGDSLEMLTEAFRRGMDRSDFIFTTGGLGPTQDDLTREAIANAIGEEPTVQSEIVDKLKQYFEGRGTPMPAHNIKQAHLIPSASFIDNPNGTAPGWWTKTNNTNIICMPGPPGEMHPMWENEIEPTLREISVGEVTLTRNIKTLGMSESAIDEIISEYFGNPNPYLGIYSKADGIHLRIIARAIDTATAEQLIHPVENAIVERLGTYIWGYDDDTPEISVGRALSERNLTLALVDSCTGGFLSNNITEVPQSAGYFKGGIISHNPDLLRLLGIGTEDKTSDEFINQEVAEQLADYIRQSLNTDFGLAVVGVLGPTDLGGKPVGQVYISISTQNGNRNIEIKLPPRRLQIKRRAANTALTELLKMIS